MRAFAFFLSFFLGMRYPNISTDPQRNVIQASDLSAPRFRQNSWHRAAVFSGGPAEEAFGLRGGGGAATTIISTLTFRKKQNHSLIKLHTCTFYIRRHTHKGRRGKFPQAISQKKKKDLMNHHLSCSVSCTVIEVFYWLASSFLNNCLPDRGRMFE